MGIMGALQIASFAKFVDVLKDYRILPDNFIGIFAVAIISVELIASLLLIDPKRRIDEEGAVVGIIALLFWSVLSAWASAKDIKIGNTGYFGNYFKTNLNLVVLFVNMIAIAWGYATFYVCNKQLHLKK